jgi:Cdc6-like AAA superfamily ATPase
MERPGPKGVALLAPFGCGKTTILNFMRAEVREAHQEFFIYCEINCWGIRKPEDAPRFALERIIESLDPFVDVQSLRGLPETYQQRVAAEPSGIVSKLIGAKQGDPIEAVKRLRTESIEPTSHRDTQDTEIGNTEIGNTETPCPSVVQSERPSGCGLL